MDPESYTNKTSSPAATSENPVVIESPPADMRSMEKNAAALNPIPETAFVAPPPRQGSLAHGSVHIPSLGA